MPGPYPLTPPLLFTQPPFQDPPPAPLLLI
nr:MAG TPA: hypothetical protein [Caudoviricetes sp.]